MGNFGQKIDKFIEIFLQQNGYVKVVQGLQNTLLIAITGLIIGIVIGTLIATVRVLPKYKRLPKVLNAICSVYVSLFRGTPLVGPLCSEEKVQHAFDRAILYSNVYEFVSCNRTCAVAM